MKSSRTPKSIQRAQREETRKERHASAIELKAAVAAQLFAGISLPVRLKVRHERE